MLYSRNIQHIADMVSVFSYKVANDNDNNNKLLLL